MVRNADSREEIERVHREEIGLRNGAFPEETWHILLSHFEESEQIEHIKLSCIEFCLSSTKYLLYIPTGVDEQALSCKSASECQGASLQSIHAIQTKNPL